MKVLSKKCVGKRNVYDLTVPGTHNFVAEGVVAHNSGARKFCIDANVDNITELAAVTAIYRPGPLKANVHRKYVKAKANPEDETYDHPVIKDILGPTYGFIVFQESFMLLAQKLAGFTEGESDGMRKTLVKKDLTSLGKKSQEKEALEKKFVEGYY